MVTRGRKLDSGEVDGVEEIGWVDNYISAVGIQHETAVNVCLVKSAETTLDVFAAHRYSHEWYRQSIVPAAIYAAPPMGFNRSFEKALSFPPSGTGMTAGSLWIEKTATPDPLDMTLDANPNLGEATRRLAAAFAVQMGKTVIEGARVVVGQVVQTGEAAAIELKNDANDYVIKPLDATGRAIMDSYMTRIQVAGEIGGTAIYKTGLVVTETKEKVGNLIDATQDFATNAIDSIKPDSVQLGPVTIPFIRIRLMTQAAPQLAGARSQLAANAVGQPAYAWMTVHVPPNAGFLAFDFTVTGQPAEDKEVTVRVSAPMNGVPRKFLRLRVNQVP